MKTYSKSNPILAKTLMTGLFFCAAVGAHSVRAADLKQEYTINLQATIPSDDFHVIPVDSGWINQTQDMGYDIATKKLQTFEKQFQYKNTSGGIQASLTGNLSASGKPQLSNGVDVIPLTVTFNNIEITETPDTVVESANANIGGRTALKISQADNQALTVNGSFTGSVSMMFEPVVGP